MIRRLVPVLFVAFVIFAATWPIWVGQRFAFRDVSHFYLPLYDYVAQRTAAEWLPLWNPLDHNGIPLVGESTTAVIYPIRYVVYSLPISSERAMNVYLLVHLLIAATTAAWLAALIGCRRIGVLAAAILYPLSGSVFSLCCNPPFLVGAAWIPLVLGASLCERSASPAKKPPPCSRVMLGRRAAWVSIGLSMMILGGDPHSALNTVLVIAAVSLFRAVPQWRVVKEFGGSWNDCPFVRSLVICGSACVLAVGLSSIQIAASIDWSRQSERASGLVASSGLYDFSLAPWHMLELVSARPWGHPFPINGQISRLLPGEGRMWTPSIYAGLVVGFAFFARLMNPRRIFADPWLPIAVISLLLCFGHFGLVWMLQQIPGVLTDSDSAVGGPYWFLVQSVPGYSSFRYPVKWLPMFAIASTMVASQWLSESPLKRERGVAVILAIVLVLGAAVAHWMSNNGILWLSDRQISLPVDEYWGQLNVAHGTGVIRFSCLCSLMLLTIMAGLRWRLNSGGKSSRSAWLTAAWLGLIAIDCVGNASTLLPAIDIDRELQLSHQASPPPIPPTHVLRTQAGIWPEVWRHTESPDRALEVAASERIAWFGRWHLAKRQAVYNSMISIRSGSYAEFWRSSNRQVAAMDWGQRKMFWTSIRRWLGIGAVSHVDQTRTIAADGLALVDVVRKTTEPVAPIRVYTDWRPQTPLAEIIDGVKRGEGMDDRGLVFPHVDAEGPTGDYKGIPPTLTVQQGGGQYSEEIGISCNVTCMLERCVYQDGNWHATLESKDAQSSRGLTVFRSSHLNQAVRIPAGDWTLRFCYRPWWKWPAVFTTAAAAVVLLFLLFFRSAPIGFHCGD